MISIFPVSPRSRFHLQTMLGPGRLFSKGLRNAMFEIGLDAARQSSDSINNSGRTGRVYNINGVFHQASAPGEVPANITTRLKRSMNYLVRGVSEIEWGSEVTYGKYLEHGTRRMAPRPFLTPVHEANGAKYAETLMEKVDDAVKRRS